MDLVTHMAVGTITGYSVGHPLIGALAAAVPDLTLGYKRRKLPTSAYDFHHSLLGLAFFTAMFVGGSYLAGGVTRNAVLAALLGYASHLALDLPTHGTTWAPPLLYPFSKSRFSIFGQEWEWFSPVWWLGMFYAFIWSNACLGLLSP